MSELAARRCFHHAGREAAARCTECGRFFCRECAVEHEDRILCAPCLRKLIRVEPRRRTILALGLRLLECALGILAAWFFFYLFGEAFLSFRRRLREKLQEFEMLDE